MLSICIPAYNHDITELVNSLHNQCIEANINFEINIIESSSDKKYFEINSKLSELKFVNYSYNQQSNGRSAKRNQLAEQSGYDNILFIDSDSMPLKNDYISNFINNSNNNIVCGGTTYLKEQKKKGYELRYKYGIMREAVNAEQRNKKPNHSFTTNNFLIKKNIINKIKFRETVTKYGHEDTILGFDLEKSGYIIKHINNSVIHLGVETNDIFLEKTETAIKNLIEIENIHDLNKDFFERISLINTYYTIKKIGINRLILLFFCLFGKKIKNHLLNSHNPSLLLFDLYKLGYYCREKK